MTGRVQGIANLTSNSVFKLCRLNKWAVLLMSLIQFSFQLRRPPNLLRRSADRLLQFHCSFALSNFLHTCVMQLNRLSPCYQVATDKCIMLFLFLIVCGVIAIIVVKVSCSSHIWVRWIWCGYFSQLSSNTTFLKLKPMCSNNLFERSIFTWNILNNLLLQDIIQPWKEVGITCIAWCSVLVIAYWNAHVHKQMFIFVQCWHYASIWS